MFSVTGKGITVKDPDLGYSAGGTAYCRCTLVNNEEYKGEKIGHFTDVVMFGYAVVGTPRVQRND